MMRVAKILTTSLVLLTTGMGVNCTLAEETSGFDKVWDAMVLYNNKENSVLQELAFVGRIQADAAWVEADTPDDSWDDITWRRARFGFKAALFGKWTAHLEGDFDLDNDFDEMYNKLTDAYVAWKPLSKTTFKALKQSAGFTLDGKTSSKKILTMERNNLTNNLWFTKEYFTGLTVDAKTKSGISSFAGIFSSGGDPEWDFDTASWFGLVSAGYKVGGADLRFDYVYQDEDENANTRDFEQVISLSCRYDSGARWGVNGDIATGIGFEDMGQSDIWGFVVQPYYDLSKRLQLVTQYTYLSSDEDNGLRLNKYENKIVEDRGDSYSEVYLGMNVYFYDHKLKWQTGIIYAEMDDLANDGGEYEGWGVSTGLRIYW